LLDQFGAIQLSSYVWAEEQTWLILIALETQLHRNRRLRWVQHKPSITISNTPTYVEAVQSFPRPNIVIQQWTL